MHSAAETIEIEATPEQTWQVLTDLRRLPEWYVPAQSIEILTEGPVREGWQFILAVKTWSGLVLKAIGTVKEFDPAHKSITWHGQAAGITGDSRWRITPTPEGLAKISHTFEGNGWLMFLSQTLGRNRKTVHQRLTNLKKLTEMETVERRT